MKSLPLIDHCRIVRGGIYKSPNLSHGVGRRGLQLAGAAASAGYTKISEIAGSCPVSCSADHFRPFKTMFWSIPIGPCLSPQLIECRKDHAPITGHVGRCFVGNFANTQFQAVFFYQLICLLKLFQKILVTLGTVKACFEPSGLAKLGEIPLQLAHA